MPVDALSVSPACAVPETAGSAVLAGTAAVGVVVVDDEPDDEVVVVEVVEVELPLLLFELPVLVADVDDESVVVVGAGVDDALDGELLEDGEGAGAGAGDGGAAGAGGAAAPTFVVGDAVALGSLGGAGGALGVGVAVGSAVGAPIESETTGAVAYGSCGALTTDVRVVGATWLCVSLTTGTR